MHVILFLSCCIMPAVILTYPQLIPFRSVVFPISDIKILHKLMAQQTNHESLFLPPFLIGYVPMTTSISSRPLKGGKMVQFPIRPGANPAKRRSYATPVGSIYDGTGYPSSLLAKKKRFQKLSAAITMIAEIRKTSNIVLNLLPQNEDVQTPLKHTWVTVFGFPQGYAVPVLMQFEKFGRIERFVMPNYENWIHIKYQNCMGARTALLKDGEIFDGNMIGVMTCDNIPIVSQKRDQDVSECEEAPAKKKFALPMRGVGAPKPTAMKNAPAPRKDTSLLTRVMEYLFFW
uniref:Nucleoporin NUP53 n=1 Tax=Leptobrachium leishanense TaxID=445787 RepID=A0A8C5QLJ4_9ANUR